MDPIVQLAADTVEKKKQALIFVNSKRSAQKVALDIAKVMPQTPTFIELAKKLGSALSSPTDQCKKLETAAKNGVVFHHAGLAPKQKTLIEDAFRQSQLPLIVCTPTLAAGVDLPAFRTIIRDVKRFSGWGMQYIPVLEYQQMAGRAGRPGKEDYGQAILIAKNENERKKLIKHFILADVEPIYSKLAVEPVLRTYVLSLLASGVCTSQKQLLGFFAKTFWAQQYNDMQQLEMIINRVLSLLSSFQFITKTADDFVSASDIEDLQLKVTPVGKRVSQLYLDPVSANQLINGLKKEFSVFGYLHLLCSTLEMRPPLKVKTAEMEAINDVLLEREAELLTPTPTIYDPEFSEYLNALKTAKYAEDWIHETSEDVLLKKYDIRPGEIHAKNEILDWLLYCSTEISHVLGYKTPIQPLTKLRQRIKYGAREELLALLAIKGIGRIRARKAYSHGLKTRAEMKKNPDLLKKLMGDKIAESILSQLGVSRGENPLEKDNL